MVAAVNERVQALAQATRTTAAPDAWAPHPGPQERFLRLSCFEALYGGAAGGGKSDALLIAAVLPIIRRSGYGRGYLGLLLRRTFPELQTSLIRRSHDLYPRLAGTWNEAKKEWRFPGGESVLFGHIENEKGVTRYQGSAFQFVGFDELTTFTEYQYLYLFSRTRSANGVPCRVRSATNPGNIGHDWVKRRWFDWVSAKSEAPAAPGEVRWFLRDGESEQRVVPDTFGALSRTFVPARLKDNPSLAVGDPAYAARLRSLRPLERARLESGDFDAVEGKREFWDREKIRVLPRVPDDVIARCRSWDFAASEGKKADAFAGARCSTTRSGLFVIEHAAHGRGAPDVLDGAFAAAAAYDQLTVRSRLHTIPQDPGAAGKIVVADMQRRYPRLAIHGRPQTGSKPSRFLPVATRALAGNVAVVDDGSWDVEGLHLELEALWSGPHDDRADAISDAFATLGSGLAVTSESESDAFTRAFEGMVRRE